MRTSEAATLFDYLYWARDTVLDAASQLDEAAFTSADTVTNRDLRATLVHELDVQWSWRERLRGADWAEWGEEAELRGEDYPTVEAVAEHWRRDEVEMRAWLASLTDADLDAPPVRDEDRGQPLWIYVMHLISHGIQQFSEAAVPAHSRRALARGHRLPRVHPGNAGPMKRRGLLVGLLLVACTARPSAVQVAPTPTASPSPSATVSPTPRPTAAPTPETRLDGSALAALIDRPALRRHLAALQEIAGATPGGNRATGTPWLRRERRPRRRDAGGRRLCGG